MISMEEMLIPIFIGILIALAITINLTNNHLTDVFLLSGFSLLAAFCYILYQAPDVSLAEVAVGSAILPLIFIISISKHRSFIVLNLLPQNCTMELEALTLLEEFCDRYRLQLVLVSDLALDDVEFKVFRKRNIDLIIESHEYDICTFTGANTSLMMNRLESRIQSYDHFEMKEIKEGEFIV
jgi:uncharacterized MnhB-related membrane protein